MLRQRGRGERERMRVREGILEEGRPDGVGRQVKGQGGGAGGPRRQGQV